jgi:C4-type Zn-finger protein
MFSKKEEEEEEETALPREFYEAIVLIKEALDDFGVPEDIAEGFLDQIEGLILKALDCAEEDSFEEDSEEEEKRPRP